MYLCLIVISVLKGFWSFLHMQQFNTIGFMHTFNCISCGILSARDAAGYFEWFEIVPGGLGEEPWKGREEGKGTRNCWRVYNIQTAVTLTADGFMRKQVRKGLSI